MTAYGGGDSAPEYGGGGSAPVGTLLDVLCMVLDVHTAPRGGCGCKALCRITVSRSSGLDPDCWGATKWTSCTVASASIVLVLVGLRLIFLTHAQSIHNKKPKIISARIIVPRMIPISWNWTEKQTFICYNGHLKRHFWQDSVQWNFDI